MTLTIGFQVTVKADSVNPYDLNAVCKALLANCNAHIGDCEEVRIGSIKEVEE